MIRARRHIRRSVILLSAVVCLLTMALWLRGRFVRDYAFTWLPWPAGAGNDHRWLKLDADSAAGQLEISWKVWTASERDRLRQYNPIAGQRVYHRTFRNLPSEYARSAPPTFWNAIGFGHYSGPTHSSIRLPYWFAAIVSAALPVAWAAKRLRRVRRILAGRCAGCGYDLRATPDRCPECGEKPMTTANR